MFAYLFALLERVKAETKGVTALEYGLIASLIAVGIIAGVTALGDSLSDMFTGIAGKIKAPA
jgi:pilus assembly protein Flp/PilA